MKTPSLKTLPRRASLWAVCAAVICLLAFREIQAATIVSQQAYLKASNTEAGDLFGIAVAVSGDTIVLGANAEDSGARGVNGNQADNAATNSGAAYVFVRQGNSWVQQAYLKASNTELQDNFGYAVALSGDTLVVGAFQEDSGARGVNGDQSGNTGTNSGAVYVFERTGTNWVQQAYLKPSNTEFGEEFGRSVAISGDTIVVGARLESSGASGVNGDQFNNDVPAAGAAYVFVRSGTNWTQQAYLKASNPGINDFFGWSVAVSGDTVAVSAIFEDSNADGVDGNQLNNSLTNSGAVYVFVRTGTNWAQEVYLKASNPGSSGSQGDEFGTSVSLHGNTLVVGARNESSIATGVNGDQSDNSALASGAAYVFTRTGSTWTQQAYLKASNTRFVSYFGWSVAAVGQDRVLVGAMSEWSNATGIDGDQTDFNATASGAAYLFTRSGGNWSQTAYLKASNTDARDNFGWGVAGSGDTLVIAAPNEASNATGVNGDQGDNSATWAGAAYVFTAVNPGSPLITSDPISRTNSATIKATFAVTASGTRPFQYQWRKNGVNLADGENIFGAQSPLLSVSQALHADEGRYDVIVRNDSGSVTSQVATLTVIDPVIAQRSATPWPTVGESFELSIEAVGTPPLSYEWRRNGSVVAGANGSTLTIPQTQVSDAGEYRVTVANAFGTSTARFNVAVNAAIVDAFNPELVTEGPFGQQTAGAIAVQTDGRIVVGGIFSRIGSELSQALARLHPDGSADPSLQSGFDGPYPINAILVLPDGKILASGDSMAPPFLFRYLPGGSADPTFTIPPDALFGGPNRMVRQPDGNILFAIQFGPITQVRRLLIDGSLDETFTVDVYEIVTALAAQADGKVLAGGLVYQIADQNVTGLGRFNADGTVDTDFHPEILLDGGLSSTAVDAVAVQEDGKIIVIGSFDQLAGQPCEGIGRLNPDGTADPTFRASLPFRTYAGVNSIALQSDGKILLGGRFESVNGQPIARLARLNADGTLDPTFAPDVDGPVQGVTIQPDGRVLVGGEFTSLGGQPRTGFGRLLNTGPAIQSLSYDGSTVKWMRGGTSPAVWTTLFQRSPDGTNWTTLGAGARISGGWQFPGITVPVGTKLRARGWVASGFGNASGWFVESVITVPIQILPVTLQTQPFGFTVLGAAGQSVVLEGSLNFQQWTPLKTNVVPANGLVPFTDPDPSQFPHRFYRGRTQ